jgi:glycerate kinase
MLANGGEVRGVVASDALGRPTRAPLGFLADGSIFVESATATGLGLLDRPDALAATSRGTGELIVRAARGWGPRKLVVGVGGTASTDGGTGAATAAGWRFLDARGNELAPGGAALRALRAVDPGVVDPLVKRSRIVAACDVANPLIGSRGAARVFAPQKGASTADVAVLDEAMSRLAEVVRRDIGIDVEAIPHGGAGGGLGAGLAAFFGAELTSGFDLIAGSVGLAEHIRGADLVITGEGGLDASTSEGKVVAGVARLALSLNVECVAVAGQVEASVEGGLPVPVARVLSLAETFGAERALADPKACVTDAVAELIR